MKSNLCLKNNPELKDYQKYVDQMVEERGFQEETIPNLFMLLIEELGEFARASRKFIGIKFADDTHKADLEDEAADVFIYFLNLCNKHGIDLERAFRNKEEKNKKRIWK